MKERYDDLEDMIKNEFAISAQIVAKRAFDDKEKLLWWEGRLDAWKWCMKQLEREGKL